MLEVRCDVLEDLPALARIMVGSFRSGFAHIVTVETMDRCTVPENIEAMLRGVLQSGQVHALIGLADGVPCGELFWAVGEEPGTAEIIALHSLPQSWGSGLGKALLDTALAAMRAEGCRQVSLWAFEENRRGRRFYEKHGLTCSGERRISEFDGAPELRYGKTLD